MSFWPVKKTLGSACTLVRSRAACLLLPASLCCGDGRLRTFVEPPDIVGEPELAAPADAPARPGRVPLAEVATMNAEPVDPPASFAPDPPSTPEPAAVGTASESSLIDDLEDGDAELAQPLEGSWYVFHDQSGSLNVAIAQPEKERAGSRYSLHMEGGGFREWGAGVGAPLDGRAAAEAKQPEPAPLDASAYDAVAFWARVDKGSEQRLHVQLHNPDRDGDLLPEQFDSKVTLSEQWEPYIVSFEELEPLGDAAYLPEPLDPARLTAVQFFFPYSDDFDVWLDDVALIVDCRYCENNLRQVSSELPDPAPPEGSPLGR